MNFKFEVCFLNSHIIFFVIIQRLHLWKHFSSFDILWIIIFYDNLKFIIIIVKLMIKICICHAYTVDLHLFHYPQKCINITPSTLPPKLINFLSRSSYFSIDIIKVSFVTKKIGGKRCTSLFRNIEWIMMTLAVNHKRIFLLRIKFIGF